MSIGDKMDPLDNISSTSENDSTRPSVLWKMAKEAKENGTDTDCDSENETIDVICDKSDQAINQYLDKSCYLPILSQYTNSGFRFEESRVIVGSDAQINSTNSCSISASSQRNKLSIFKSSDHIPSRSKTFLIDSILGNDKSGEDSECAEDEFLNEESTDEHNVSSTSSSAERRARGGGGGGAALLAGRAYASWLAVNHSTSFHDVFKSSLPQCLKTKVFNQCVLPTLTYGAETWTLTRTCMHKIKVAQRAMERTMLGISLVDRIPNVEIDDPEGAEP
ncbi:unnamed protein product [Plutella xylostella]|uniref:(diamondback moth) hypothetical protein n=1 Tax=Plutella xylostella TaxID=51655 RepID=A0A8S4GDE5_PLUXY|nr:unnamed protein product [Plutella xylostella]